MMMSATLIYGSVAIILFVLGLLCCLAEKSQIRQLLSLNICSASLFLIMVALAYLPTETTRMPLPDALLHALVLTGIVVAVSATALGLAIVRKCIHAQSNREGL